MRTSTGTVSGWVTAAALATLLLGACGRPAPADEAQMEAAPDPAAQEAPATNAGDTDVQSAQVDTSAGGGSADQMGSNEASASGDEDTTSPSLSATPVTAPQLTVENVTGVVDPTPGRAGVKVTSDGPLLAPTPTTAPPTAAADPATGGAGGIHVVQPGDTLSVIAETYGIPMQAIADANGLVDIDNLTLGQELTIPASN